MEIKLVPGFDKPTVVGELFAEYTKGLVDGVPAMQGYLDQQGYEEEIKRLEAKYGEPEGRLYLAYTGDTPLGCVALKKLSSAHCELKRLYVRPEVRGKHLGETLVEKLLEDAANIGYEYMYLDTQPYLKEAVSLYKKLGFVEIEKYNDSPIAETIYMRKKLK